MYLPNGNGAVNSLAIKGATTPLIVRRPYLGISKSVLPPRYILGYHLKVLAWGIIFIMAITIKCDSCGGKTTVTMITLSVKISSTVIIVLNV